MTDNGTLQLFSFEEHEVRVIIIEGEPWWVANDVCAVLEIIDSPRAVSRLDEEEVRQTPVLDGRGIAQQTNIVNESGLYDLIFRSDKPMAKQFRKWVTSVVLPAIRRQGDIYSDSEYLLAAVTRLVDIEREQRRLDVEAVHHRKVLQEHGARLDGIEHNTGWMTALAYAKVRKAVLTDDKTMQKLGRAAAWATRADFRQEPRKTRDQRFGEVNLYPEEALAKAWDVLGLESGA